MVERISVWEVLGLLVQVVALPVYLHFDAPVWWLMLSAGITGAIVTLMGMRWVMAPMINDTLVALRTIHEELDNMLTEGV